MNGAINVGELVEETFNLGDQQAELNIRNLSKYFGARRSVVALDNISLNIHQGELVVLLGPSGCGKTTLLRSIAGLEEASSGQIELFGRTVVDVGHGVNIPSNRRRVGMVFQNYALWPHMKAWENVAYPLRARGVKRSNAKGQAVRMLELLRCGHLADRYPSQMSGGQQQRIALGRGLIGEPETVLFDEPLSNIDAQLRREVRAEIRRLHKELGFTAVYVTHDQDEGLGLGDRIAIMQAGHIVQLGVPSEIYDAPSSSAIAHFMGIENSFTFRIRAGRATSDIGVLTGAWGRLASHSSQELEIYVRSQALKWRETDDREGKSDHEVCVIKGGVLTDMVLTGKMSESIVSFGDRKLFSASEERFEPRNIGHMVECYFDPREVFVFPVPSKDTLGATIDDPLLNVV